MNKKTTDALFLTLLFAALLIFFHEALLGNRTLIWDAADYFYPTFFTVSSSIRSGELPLWTPYIFNGFPIIAAVQAQVFYPLNLLFLPFTSFTPYAVHLSLILHFFLAGSFMYLLCRTYLEDRWACLLSAVVYMFSGFMIGHIEHVTIIEAMAWLPLVLLFLEKSLLNRRLAYGVFAGFFFGISILAGHPQTSHSMGLILVAHTIYRSTAIYAKEKNKILLLHCISALFICLATGALIAAVQILPTFELVKESTRGAALSFEYAAKSAQLSLRDAVLLIIPNYFGALTGPYWGDIDISQNIIYVGLLPFMLMGLALFFAKKHPDVIYLFIMAILFLLLSLGENGPVFRLFYSYLPGFNYFRGPANTLFLYAFCAALLSGYGLNSLACGMRKLTFFLYIAVALLLCIVIYQLSPGPPAEIAGPAAKNIQSGFQAFLGFFILSAIIIYISVFFPRFRNFCYAALVLLAFMDLYMHFSDSLTIGLKEAPQTLEKRPEMITAIKKDSGILSDDKPAVDLNDSELRQGLFRVYTKPEGLQGTGIFGYNRAMLFRTFLVEGSEPLEMGRHRRLIETLSVKNLDNLLKITNSKYITSIDSGDVNAQRYATPLPRTFIVANARFLDNDDRVLDALASFDPSSEVLISGTGTDITHQTMDPSAWSSTVSRYTGNLVEIRTQSGRDGFLVLSDTYYPGWQAWVDGVEYPVMRANYDFRALHLPAGEHTVVYKFTSRYLTFGLFISLGGILLVSLFFVRTIYSLFSPKKTQPLNPLSL